MNPQEILSTMDELVAKAEAEDNRSLTTEEVTSYKKLEEDLVQARETEEIGKRQKAYQAPRISIRPQSVIKGTRDDGRYTYDRFLRGDQGAAKELADFADGGKVLRWPLKDGQVDVESYAQTETTTAGGYLVPTVTQDILIKITKAFGGISTQAAHLNTNHGAPINFPSIDDTANSSAIAAINAAPGSGGADMVFGQVTMGAYKYAATGTGQAGLKVPRELVDDALFDVTGLVTEMLGVRLARKMAADYAQGTGGGAAPSGLFWQTGDVLALSGGLVQATAVAQLKTVEHALDPSYRNENCVWIMNDGTAAVLEGFVDSTNRPLLVQNYLSGLGGPVRATSLFGYPVQIDQASPAFSATASANPAAVNTSYIAFGDINSAFLIRDVQGIGIAVDPYTAIGTNQVLYFGYARTDSVVRNRKAYVLSAGYHS